MIALSLTGFWICAAGGAAGAWLMRRRTMLSVRNLYLAAALGALLCGVAVLGRWWGALLVVGPLAAAPTTGAFVGRRWRLAGLGAGEELRDHELARRWAWQPAPARRAGERVYIRSQGEIIRERRWPDAEPYVPMTGEIDGPRLPRSEGQHIFSCGGTGTGKTTSALRIVAARAEAPFILIDPRAPDTDRWQPISGEIGEVVARVVEPIKASEEYYSDMLRLYLGVVARVLEHAGCWPPSLPFLIGCCQLRRFPRIRELCSDDEELLRRVAETGDWISSPEGRKAVAGGAVRLQVVMGEAWRPVLAPRITPSGEHVAVSLARAIEERAVVLWRTYVDDCPRRRR